VPFDSARIQICKQALHERNPSSNSAQNSNPLTRGNSYIQMAVSLLGNLKTKMLYRLDVNFQLKDKGVDSWIGRTAHIQFLECQPLMKMIVYRYRDFFS
jgi:hypothetical protein